MLCTRFRPSCYLQSPQITLILAFQSVILKSNINAFRCCCLNSTSCFIVSTLLSSKVKKHTLDLRKRKRKNTQSECFLAFIAETLMGALDSSLPTLRHNKVVFTFHSQGSRATLVELVNYCKLLLHVPGVGIGGTEQGQRAGKWRGNDNRGHFYRALDT